MALADAQATEQLMAVVEQWELAGYPATAPGTGASTAAAPNAPVLKGWISTVHAGPLTGSR